MNVEKTGGSPFSAQNDQERQAKWHEWRTRHVEWHEEETPSAPIPKERNEKAAPLPAGAPALQDAAGSHRQLDAVLRRHAQAVKHAGAFTPPSGNGGSPR